MLSLNEKEKERILKLHESRRLNSITEQGSPGADRMVDNKSRELASRGGTSNNNSNGSIIDVENALQRAYGGMGTDVDGAYRAFESIPPENFDQVIAYLISDKFKVGGNVGLVAAFNDEYGVGNLGDMVKLKKLFKQRDSGFEINYQTGGMMGQKVSEITITGQPNTNQGDMKPTTSDLPDRWPENLSCVPSHPNAKERILNDGSVGYMINGEIYYDNGRKSDKTGKMVNYTCEDEVFKGGGNTGQDITKSSGSTNTGLTEYTKRIQKLLNIDQTGVMDQKTINAAYNTLSKNV